MCASWFSKSVEKTSMTNTFWKATCWVSFSCFQAARVELVFVVEDAVLLPRRHTAQITAQLVASFTLTKRTCFPTLLKVSKITISSVFRWLNCAFQTWCSRCVEPQTTSPPPTLWFTASDHSSSSRETRLRWRNCTREVVLRFWREYLWTSTKPWVRILSLEGQLRTEAVYFSGIHFLLTFLNKSNRHGVSILQSAESAKTKETLGHILVQLTACLRNLADVSGTRILFLKGGLVNELCCVMEYHHTDADLMLNISRIFRWAHPEDWLIQHKFSETAWMKSYSKLTVHSDCCDVYLQQVDHAFRLLCTYGKPCVSFPFNGPFVEDLSKERGESSFWCLKFCSWSWFSSDNCHRRHRVCLPCDAPFRPSATVSRIGLMESRLRRRCPCHGGPPLPPKVARDEVGSLMESCLSSSWRTPPPGWLPPTWCMVGALGLLRWLSVLVNHSPVVLFLAGPGFEVEFYFGEFDG